MSSPSSQSRGPRFRIDRNDAAVVANLTRLCAEWAAKIDKDHGFWAPETYANRFEVQGLPVLTALLAHGEVELWPLSLQRPARAYFDEACRSIRALEGVEYLESGKDEV